ncbi:MAG: glycosyltransferase [Lachnospiraceae bacterium]|nr:glycosyltransferase [Candidatus Colinaster equi]
MKVSIIVPVFNMASDGKLSFCLDSLINQTIDDYEIIAVDDCSTDNSMDILRQYEEKYPDKFHAIHSEVNHHQGGAKNIALHAAKGEWISFIDADDWIVPDYYEQMLEVANRTGADMVGCDYCEVSEHTFTPGHQVANSRPEQTGVLGATQKRSMIIDGGSLCTKIYKRERIIKNSLFFPEDIFYEDNAVGNSYLIMAQHYEYIAKPLYYYYQHNSSTVHTFSVTRCLDRMAAGRMIVEEAKRHGYYDEFKPELEFSFTQLFYVNTLFTYMPCVRPTNPKFVRDITKEMLTFFPDFRENEYYINRVGAEEKKLINMACASPLRFYIYYKLLWAYRNLRRAISGKH